MTPEAEIVQPEMAMAVREQPQPVSLWGASEPSEVLIRAERVASSLKDVIKRQGLISNIQGKEYPRCEAWTLLGTMIGVFPILCWSRPVENGWEARVEARTKDGSIVGAAEAQCLKTERNWKDRDDFALRSMAQTRATAKALRMPLGFVMTLAGYESTPAEEMTHEMVKSPARATQGKMMFAKPQNAPQANVERSKANPEATQEQKTKFLTMLAPVKQAALQYAIDKAWILPTEGLAEIPLSKVPTTQKQFQAIMDGIKALMDGQAASEMDEIEVVQEPEEFTIKGGDEWFRQVIVPIPPKGMKRDEYLKDPRTINDLEKNELFGWWANFQPKSWTDKKGNEHPPSDADIKFREALDAAGEHYGFKVKD